MEPQKERCRKHCGTGRVSQAKLRKQRSFPYPEVSRTTEGTPQVGSSMCRDQETLRVKGARKTRSQSPQVQQTTKTPSPSQVHALGGRLGTDSMSAKEERRCARSSRRRPFSGNSAGPYWSYQLVAPIGTTNACSTSCQEPIASISTSTDTCTRAGRSKNPGRFFRGTLGSQKGLELKCDGSHEHAPCAGHENNKGIEVCSPSLCRRLVEYCMHGFKTCRRFEGICEAICQSSHVDWFKNHISNPIIKLALCAIRVSVSHWQLRCFAFQ